MPVKEPEFNFLKKYAPTQGQTFTKEFVERGGKRICVDDWIQAGREDTEIYATLEKYGCIDRMELDSQGVYADVTTMKDLKGSLEQINEAERIWNALPKDVKKEFNNDKFEFVDRGEQWLKNKIEKEKQTVNPGVTEKAPEVTENGK